MKNKSLIENKLTIVQQQINVFQDKLKNLYYKEQCLIENLAEIVNEQEQVA